jgi:hypothetical protein
VLVAICPISTLLVQLKRTEDVSLASY